jgi:hypothetical protein
MRLLQSSNAMVRQEGKKKGNFATKGTNFWVLAADDADDADGTQKRTFEAPHLRHPRHLRLMIFPVPGLIMCAGGSTRFEIWKQSSSSDPSVGVSFS